MKIETETRDDHQVKILAEFEPEIYERKKHQAARKISQNTKIPGFRPGKAPFDIVRRLVGDKAIDEEALELLVDEVYPEVIKEAGIEPSGPGSLEEVVSTEPVKLSFLVPLAPTVDLNDFRATRLPYEPRQVEESEVDHFIDHLRTSYATMNPVERSAHQGDMFFATIDGLLVHPEEGKNPELVKDRPLQVAIQEEGHEDKTEWPFPGFSRELIGLSAGDSKKIAYTFPQESVYESLRGQDVEFTVSVQSVKEMELPEVTDEFAQSLGSFQTVDDLRKSVQAGLEGSAKEEYDTDYYARLIDTIAKQAKIQYPPQVLQNEIDNILNTLERDLANQKMDLETYLKVREMDRDTFIEKEVKPAAVKRLERSLILDEVARAEKLEIDDASLQQSFTETLGELQNSGDFERLRKGTTNRQLANAVAMEAASRVMNRKVLDRLKAIATGQADQETSESEAAPEGTPTDEVLEPAHEAAPEKSGEQAKPKSRKKKSAGSGTEKAEPTNEGIPPAES